MPHIPDSSTHSITLQGTLPEIHCTPQAPPRMSSFRAADGGFAILDGYLFDTSTKEVSFAEVAFEAYQRRKATSFEALRGGFSLVLWDPPQETLLFVRDATGLGPCFYVWERGLLLVSSSMDILLLQPEVKGDWNRILIAEQLQGYFHLPQQKETYYQEIRRLLPAHYLTATKHGLSSTRYWDPLPPGFAWANEAESAEVEALLERAVQRVLSVGADSLALSGGFDSVSLAALVAEQTNPSDRLHAISMRMLSSLCDEGETQVAVAHALKMPQLICTLEEAARGQNYVEASLSLSATSPSPVLSVWQAMFGALLNMARAKGLRNLMMGTGGDELFTVGFTYGQDLFQSFRIPALWRFFQMWRRSSPFHPLHVARTVLWSGALRPTLKTLLRSTLRRIHPNVLKEVYLRRIAFTTPDWLPRHDKVFLEQLLDRRLSSIESTTTHVPSEYIRMLHHLPHAPMFMFETDQAMIWGQQYGFTILYPFFDQDLFGLTLRTSPEVLFQDGWTKTPLRRLVAQRFPQVALPRKKVDFTQMLHNILRKQGKAVWHAMKGIPALQAVELVDHDAIARHMDDYFNGRNDKWTLVWAILSTESWLHQRSQRFAP